MFKLNKKNFYIIEELGAGAEDRKLLELELKTKGIDCLVVGRQLEIIDVERNK